MPCPYRKIFFLALRVISAPISVTLRSPSTRSTLRSISSGRSCLRAQSRYFDNSSSSVSSMLDDDKTVLATLRIGGDM
jgi:hypothetical protein